MCFNFKEEKTKQKEKKWIWLKFEIGFPIQAYDVSVEKKKRIPLLKVGVSFIAPMQALKRFYFNILVTACMELQNCQEQ
jgi:hypothetical protein